MEAEKCWETFWQAARAGKGRLERIVSRSSRVWKTAVWAAFEGGGGERVGGCGFWLLDIL